MSAAVPSDMRSTYIEEYGEPASNHIKQCRAPVPKIGRNEVLIHVKAASLNPIDYKIVHGMMKSITPMEFPIRLGYDAAGTVAAVGTGVDKFKVGDEVYTRVDHESMGTIADYAKSSINATAFKPRTLSFSEAAGVPLAALTAYQALTSIIKLKYGDRILVLGGGGSVGSSAIQIASIIGAKDIATTCGESSADKCRQLGANVIVDRNKQKFWEELRDYDAVFDTTNEPNHAFSVLRKDGICVSIAGLPTAASLERSGISVPTAAQVYLGTMTAPTLLQAKVMNVRWETMFMVPSSKDLDQLTEWIDHKRFKMAIHQVFPYEQAAQAFATIESGKAKGKVIISVNN